MKKVIKTGILSFGKSGTFFHAPFLEEHSGFELCAVVERSKKKAHLTYPNIKSYASVDELLADADIELVVINTPNSTHFEFADKAIKANKHVLVEKAFTVTSSEAKELFETARKLNRHILPFQNRRYDSDFLSVKEVLDSGKLGKLIEVHFRYDRYIYELSNNALREKAMPGNGITYNLGPHVLDAAIALFGYPIKWTKNIGHFRPNIQIDDFAQFQLTYPNNLQVFITLSLLVAEEQPAFILNGVNGSYIKNRTDVQENQLLMGMKPDHPDYGKEAADQYGTLTTFDANYQKIQQKIMSKKSSYINVFENVFQTLVEGRPYPVKEEEIIQQLEILEK